MGNSYGGLVWSSEQAPQETSLLRQGLSLGAIIGAGLGASAVYKSHYRGKTGLTPIDNLAARARYAENLSPAQVFKTFGVSDFLSPFTSDAHRGQPSGTKTWDAAEWASDSSFEYLKSVTGKNTNDLAALGVRRGMNQARDGTAEKFVWRRSPSGGISGSLFAVRKGGKQELLSENIALFDASPEFGAEADLMQGRPSRSNRAALSMMHALNLSDVEGFDEQQVGRVAAPRLSRKERQKKVQQLRAEGKGEVTVDNLKRHYLPIQAPTLSNIAGARNLDDLSRRTQYQRGILAFEGNRFNRLVGSLVGTKSGELIRPGSALTSFTRYGVGASKVGAAFGALATVDHFRRNFSIPGELAATGMVSAGVGILANKMGAGGNRSIAIAAGASAVQLLAPGFDQGVLQGIATTGVNALRLRGGSMNPFNYYRRTVEGFLPGVSSWETGALAAIGAVAASNMKNPLTGEYLSDSERLGGFRKNLGLDPKQKRLGTVRDLFYKNLKAETTGLGGEVNHRTMGGRRAIRKKLAQDRGAHDSRVYMNDQWEVASRAHKMSLSKDSPMNKALLDNLEKIQIEEADKLAGMKDPSRIQRYLSVGRKEARGILASAKLSFFGADVKDPGMKDRIREMGFRGPAGRFAGRTSLVAGAVFLGQQLLTGGLLGSMETSEEIDDIYNKGKPIAVKKSRYWEAGGQPFEGGDTEYYRPSLYHMYMNRTRSKGIWGENEPNPISKFVQKNFTYNLERKNYYDRPYPVTGTAFEDVPIIGDMLGATIGRIIKPPKLMHVEEWARAGQDGAVKFASTFDGSYREPSYKLGAVGPGVPTSPYASLNRLGNMSYQSRQLSGLTGFVRNTISEAITGDQNWAVSNTQLASAGEIDSLTNKYWELDAGGFGFMSESIRRVLPSGPKRGEQINPLANSMPSWVTEKFRMGDPYRKLKHGEARLPGAGYATLHPELQGVDPEAYPMAHRYKILADIAPNSREFKMIQSQMYERREAGVSTAYENEIMDRSDAQIKDILSGIDWNQDTPGAIKLPGSGVTSSLWLGAQQLLRTVAAPIEFVIPMGFRPISKLMHNRDPIEEYESRRFTTQLAFWTKPVRDWFRPATYSLASMLGFDDKPSWRKKADATNAYFDQLEFVKQMRLADQAGAAGDASGRSRALWAASQTRFGVNPQGNAMGIYWTLPAEERPFFNAFAHAQGKDRSRILEMVPSDMVHLYKATWSRLDSGQELELYAGQQQKVDEEYMKSQYYGLVNSITVPDDDFIGWHEDVDLEDVQVRYVDKFAGDLADYGLWESGLKKSMAQPFLEGSAEQLREHINPSNLGEVRAILNARGSTRNLTVMPSSRGNSVIDFNDSRDAEAFGLVSGILNGY